MKNYLTPILIRAAGRSGTTLSMYILSCSDEIWFHKEYPFESRDLTYLLRVAQVCTSANKKTTTRQELLQENLTTIGRYPNQTSIKYLSEGNESLSLMLTDLWKGYSREACKVMSSRYYAEKVTEGAAIILNKAFTCKNLFLFRDPRAEMLSIMRFNEKRKDVTGFGWRPDDTTEEFAKRLCHTRRGRMQHLAKIENDERRIKILYEDLIVNFDAKVSSLESFLETKICRDRLQAGLSSFSGHMTSSDAIKSIDDWKRELPDNIKEIFSTQLKDELAALGYEP